MPKMQEVENESIYNNAGDDFYRICTNRVGLANCFPQKTIHVDL